MIAQFEAGRVLCLCIRNEEEHVFSLRLFRRNRSSTRQSKTAKRPTGRGRIEAFLNVRSGDKVARIEGDFDADWARLLQVTVVAEVPFSDAQEFWAAPPEVQAQVIRKLTAMGSGNHRRSAGDSDLLISNNIQHAAAVRGHRGGYPDGHGHPDLSRVSDTADKDFAVGVDCGKG
jgi:hypothetical protein